MNLLSDELEKPMIANVKIKKQDSSPWVDLPEKTKKRLKNSTWYTVEQMRPLEIKNKNGTIRETTSFEQLAYIGYKFEKNSSLMTRYPQYLIPHALKCWELKKSGRDCKVTFIKEKK